MNRRTFVLLVLFVGLLWAGTASAGPVEDVTNWLREQFVALWNAFMDFMHDLVVFAIETTLELVRVIVYALPSLDFLSGLTVCTILSNAGPWAKWAIVTFHLAESFVLLSGALVFRLLRVILTLFQWT